MPKLLGQYSKT